MKIEWRDSGREPRCKPDPAFPQGVDLDLSAGAEKTCFTELPYPARRCGLYIIECPTCELRTGVTTAGRPDDPRSVKMACKPLPPPDVWRSMVSAPMNATWVEVKYLDHENKEQTVQAHWANGGGDEQPRFRGWFRRAGDSGFVGIPDPHAWRPLQKGDPA